jgi:hypothetical protein
MCVGAPKRWAAKSSIGFNDYAKFGVNLQKSQNGY